MATRHPRDTETETLAAPESPELRALREWKPGPCVGPGLLLLAASHARIAALTPVPTGPAALAAFDPWQSAKTWVARLPAREREALALAFVDRADVLREDIRGMLSRPIAPDLRAGVLLHALSERDYLESVAQSCERGGLESMRDHLASVDAAGSRLTADGLTLAWDDGLAERWAGEPGAWWAELWAQGSGAAR